MVGYQVEREQIESRTVWLRGGAPPHQTRSNRATGRCCRSPAIARLIQRYAEALGSSRVRTSPAGDVATGGGHGRGALFRAEGQSVRMT